MRAYGLTHADRKSARTGYGLMRTRTLQADPTGQTLIVTSSPRQTQTNL